MTLDELNGMDRAAFVAALGHVFEHSPWVASAAFDARPFASPDALHRAMVDAMMSASSTTQLALLRSHPELAGRAAVRGALTADSTAEQSGAGLTACSPEEYERLRSLNARYNARFGFPFILAVHGHDRAGVIAAFERRVGNELDDERAECLQQVARIARIRLDALLGVRCA